MQFDHPYFLFGLAAISVPVIIHLFNFRKFRRVLFTNVRFIKDIQLETRKQSRLKHLIILALRILAVASLVLAFAQPFIPLSELASTEGSDHLVSVYTDNSFSMEAQNDDGRLFETARKKAGEVAAAYKAGDKYQLLTNDFEGLHQRLVTREEYLEMLENIDISPSVQSISEVYKRQTDLLKTAPSKSKNLYLISDFQKSSTDLQNIPYDSTVRIFLVPLKAHPSPDISVDSCWFASPVHQAGKNVRLFVKVKNHSDQVYERVPLKLTINGNQKAATSFDLPPLGEQVIGIGYNDPMPGNRFGTIEISDSPIVYDDKFYFSYTVSSQIPVLVIDKGMPNPFLTALLGKDSSFSYHRQPENSLDVSEFKQYRLIILDGIPSVSSGLAQELQRFVSDGGSLLIAPPVQMEGTSYTHLLNSLQMPVYGAFRTTQQKVASIALNHPLFQEVFDQIPENMDLPVVTGWYETAQKVRAGTEILMTLQNGSGFLCTRNLGAGKVYQLSSPLDPKSGNFPQHALFVPVIYKIALLSEPAQKLWYTLGSDEKISYKSERTGEDAVVKIRQLRGTLEFIPEQSGSGGDPGLFVHQQIKDAGHYEVIDGDQATVGLAFNYQRKESQTEPYSAEELKDQAARLGLKNVTLLDQPAKNLTEVINELYSGIRLWKLFIIFALVFLAAEVSILRFWK